MQEKRRYFFLLWCASVLGVLTFIFANSLRSAAASGEQSAEVFGILKTILFFFPFLTHGIVRLLAHAAEFALLGAYFALLPRFFADKPRALQTLFVLSGLIFPFIDEGIQFFIPGRDASLADVLTDGVGYLLGVAFTLLVATLILRKKGGRYAQKDL